MFKDFLSQNACKKQKTFNQRGNANVKFPTEVLDTSFHRKLRHAPGGSQQWV
jgi:hypothetical protein